MKILIHDYCGHPFQIQLSRALAGKGHNVLHLYSASFQTPKGDIEKKENDSRGFNIKGISSSSKFNKYSYTRRLFQENRYASILNREIDKFDPEVVVCSNTPILINHSVVKSCKSKNRRFVLWLQDFLSIGIRSVLERKSVLFANVAEKFFTHYENLDFKMSDAIVSITEDFNRILLSRGVLAEKIHTIPNWAPLGEIKKIGKQNPWSRLHQLDDKVCILYSGTLGLKHNPEILVELAKHFRNENDVRVVVISEGKGADYLAKKKIELELDKLIILGFQPYGEFSYVLGSADVLVGILDKEAGIYSVPSKILSYLCAGKPIVLSAPSNNLAAKILRNAESGFVCEPGDSKSLMQAIDDLVLNERERDILGLNAQKYSEEFFGIEKIADTFEKVFEQVKAGS